MLSSGGICFSKVMTIIPKIGCTETLYSLKCHLLYMKSTVLIIIRKQGNVRNKIVTLSGRKTYNSAETVGYVSVSTRVSFKSKTCMP